MRLAIVSFTEHGSRLNEALNRSLTLKGYDCDCFCVEKYASKYGLKPLKEPIQQWTGRMFQEKEGLLFISASGIAVRSIAPFVCDKTKDPAVVVMDERGVFAISLLSGHLGGANELTGALANLTGAVPVITTATDVNGRFAVDVFAKKNHLYITDLKMAKKISAEVLDEKPVGFYSDFSVTGRIPEELVSWDPTEIFEGDFGICISLQEEKAPYKKTLRLIPRVVTVGVGCKKGTDERKIEELALKTLRHHGISIHGVERIASIDLKREEKGLLEFAEKYHLEFATYPAQELQKAEGNFSESPFVESVTGVSNVCERSAVLGSGMGKLIQKKTADNGVTIALAVREWSVDFE